MELVTYPAQPACPCCGRSWCYQEVGRVLSSWTFHGTGINRTWEYGYARLSITGTNFVATTWLHPDEDSAYRAILDQWTAYQNRSREEQEAEQRAIDAGQRRYAAQLAYACGERD